MNFDPPFQRFHFFLVNGGPNLRPEAARVAKADGRQVAMSRVSAASHMGCSQSAVGAPSGWRALRIVYCMWFPVRGL